MTATGLILPMALYAGLNYADYRSSVDAKARGGVELNPVVQTVGLGPAKLLTAAAQTVGDVMIARRHKHGVWVYRAALTVGYALLVKSNSGVNRGK